MPRSIALDTPGVPANAPASGREQRFHAGRDGASTAPHAEFEHAGGALRAAAGRALRIDQTGEKGMRGRQGVE